ncbi:MAG TPA: class I SAM-dependent methyltransferase [Reyranellaceae bacterium]|nr:class I SAM-dependent methyltransferase [Reyranellaceae bacterium]
MTLPAAGDLSPAARAFDSIAGAFDERFGEWLSVAAQRRAVRAALAEAFAPGSRLIEIGGGTGEDACWLLDSGREVLVTDPSPAMVGAAAAKLRMLGRGEARVAAAERLDELASELGSEPGFDGAYSNFAALNCVTDLRPVGRGLARLLRPGAPALLVLFGTCCPGELIVEAVRDRPRNMFRRFARGDVRARLGAHDFAVRYHRAAAVRAAMAPWFDFSGRQAIGLAVPPSAAEPWISRHPRLLAALEAFDRGLSRPLAIFGDHVLYRFVRNSAEVGG